MFIAANFVSAVGMLVNVVLTTLYWVVLIRALLSWVNPDPNNVIVRMLHDITEPILNPIRKLLPFSLKMTFDISPLIAFLIIMFLKFFLVQTLQDLAFRMRAG
jgi:YggT family protein